MKGRDLPKNSTREDTLREWGVNCATLGYSMATSHKIIMDWQEVANLTAADVDVFFEGHTSGPRSENFLYYIPAISNPVWRQK